MRFNMAITSDRFDRRLSHVACFGGAPVILTCAVVGLQRVGARPAELLTGLLAAAALAVSMVVLGIVNGPKSPAV